MNKELLADDMTTFAYSELFQNCWKRCPDYKKNPACFIGTLDDSKFQDVSVDTPQVEIMKRLVKRCPHPGVCTKGADAVNAINFIEWKEFLFDIALQLSTPTAEGGKEVTVKALCRAVLQGRGASGVFMPVFNLYGRERYNRFAANIKQPWSWSHRTEYLPIYESCVAFSDNAEPCEVAALMERLEAAAGSQPVRDRERQIMTMFFNGDIGSLMCFKCAEIHNFDVKKYLACALKPEPITLGFDIYVSEADVARRLFKRCPHCSGHTPPCTRAATPEELHNAEWAALITDTAFNLIYKNMTGREYEARVKTLCDAIIYERYFKPELNQETSKEGF